jgi:hypothetical protein
MRNVFAILIFAFIGGYSTSSTAQRFDIEIDPIAYALKGYSVHGGYLWSSFRLDAGVFGIEVPEAVHGNDGFRNRIDGVGTKLDFYLIEPGSKLFVGLESGIMRSTVEWRDTGEKVARTLYGVGVRIGYRLVVREHFTVTPWIGLGYTLNAADQHVSGRVFETSAFQPFPTIHLGYSF